MIETRRVDKVECLDALPGPNGDDHVTEHALGIGESSLIHPPLDLPITCTFDGPIRVNYLTDIVQIHKPLGIVLLSDIRLNIRWQALQFRPKQRPVRCPNTSPCTSRFPA